MSKRRKVRHEQPKGQGPIVHVQRGAVNVPVMRRITVPTWVYAAAQKAIRAEMTPKMAPRACVACGELHAPGTPHPRTDPT